MCGIAGVLSSKVLDPALVDRLIGPIAHRGPDDRGSWSDCEAGIGLGHRRLSIVDLSPAGHEPMHSASGRLVVTYNGEIYNHRDLRRQLEDDGKVPDGGWRGHSDIETLLQAIECWGLRDAIDRAIGMFAFALWDRASGTLSLVRDRFGEKPLYYGWAGSDFIFGSELKALRAHPRFDAAIDRQALRLFSERMYVPAPLSIYRGIFKLPPASILELTREAASAARSDPPSEGAREGGLKLQSYWSYRDVVAAGLSDPIENEADALGELDRVLSQAIAGQAEADVPVGAFLSGGIDSSAIVALYQRTSSTPVRTFTIGFDDPAFNEAPFARAVAKQLGTVHHEHIFTDRDARDTIPLLPAIYDEPFADTSQLPTYLVCRAARSQVIVALTGDGGDELFGGYNRHFLAPKLWGHVSRVPGAVRGLGAPLSRLPTDIWNRAGGLIPGLPRASLGAKIQKMLRVSASARTFDDIYASFLNEWSAEAGPVVGANQAAPAWDLDVGQDAPDSVRMMYCDAVSYLPDDILCKVDRASMAVSLETRVPFLDHRVAELAARIPIEFKIRGGEGKRILRSLLYREAPRALFERPKTGFGVPIGDWIKGPLREWAEDLLDPGRMKAEGWFDPQIVRRRWAGHLDGRRESTPAIWAILMFQAWLREQEVAPAVAA